MARFLLLSEVGDGLGLAMRLKAEGHDVSLWLRDKSEPIGKGIIDEAKRYERTIIADCTGFGVLMDALREHGFKTFAGSEFADKLESDRKFSEELMHSAGIKTPASVRVKDMASAEEFISKYDRVVVKPEGALSGTHPSEVAADQDNAREILKSLESEYGDSSIDIELQEFQSGIAVSTEGWFNGVDWIPSMFNHTLERKERYAGDVGDSTGCMGNIVWACGVDDIVESTLLKLTSVLRTHAYVGPIDINCIVNDSGIYGLEFTPRFGYDAFPTLLFSLFEEDFGNFVEDVASGNEPEAQLRQGFGAGVRLLLPEKTKVTIRYLDEMFYPYCVEFVDGEARNTSETLGVMNGFGDTLDEALADAYNRVSNIKITKLIYRNDLIEVFRKDYHELLGTEGWIAFDLDGTLAKYSDWSEDIGEPQSAVVERAIQHIKEGKLVRVLTARGINDWNQRLKIHSWLKANLGYALEVTHSKDPDMIVLYDDRVIPVVDGEVIEDAVSANV